MKTKKSGAHRGAKGIAWLLFCVAGGAFTNVSAADVNVRDVADGLQAKWGCEPMCESEFRLPDDISIKEPPSSPPTLSDSFCEGGGVGEACAVLPNTPETELACQVAGNYGALLEPACKATVDSANQVVSFLWNQGYVRATPPVVKRICPTLNTRKIVTGPYCDPDSLRCTSEAWRVHPEGIKSVSATDAMCLTAVVEVLYSARSDAAVIECTAYADGATTVQMDCGGTPGIAAAPLSIAITPEIPGASGQRTVTINARSPLYDSRSLNFEVNW